MAYILPNLYSTVIQSRAKSSAITARASISIASPQAKLEAPPSVWPALVQLAPPGAPDKKKDERNEFYLNLGLAVRTLREDLPLIFTKELDYDIYRDDITFRDPLNTFSGIQNYKTLFQALRFYGRIFFRAISLDVVRVWQPSEAVILVRWNVRGVPRVPWEANSRFQGTSRYKLDKKGKIYVHNVDNVAFDFPCALKPTTFVLDLATVCSFNQWRNYMHYHRSTNDPKKVSITLPVMSEGKK